jgi:restriction system protein
MVLKGMLSVAKQLERERKAQERKRIAEAKRLERERVAREKRRIAEAKRLERERVALEKKKITEAKRLKKQSIAQEKKIMVESERDHKAQTRKEKSEYIENNKVIANNRTNEAQKLLESMDGIIDHALSNDCLVDLDSLKTTDEFLIAKPKKPPEPEPPTYNEIPLEPNPNDLKYQFHLAKPKKLPEPKKQYHEILDPNPNDPKYNPKFGVFDFQKKLKKRKAHEKFEEDKKVWERNQKLKSEYEAKLKENEDFHRNRVEVWENNKKNFLTEQRLAWEQGKKEMIEINLKLNQKYEAKLKENENTYLMMLEDWENKKKDFLTEQEILKEVHKNYLKSDPKAIQQVSNIVLSNSKYHEEFPQEFELEYNPENKILIIEYQLPSLDDIPTLKEVKYIQTRDEFTEKHITKTQLDKLYDNILYHITLRTIHELYEAHQVDALEAIIFNGHVNSINPSTGQETNACVLSIQANKNEFEEINLAMVEPKACFKKLKGVGSSKLHSLTPIPPLVKLEREDSRFTDSYSVVDDIDAGYNLASMDWQDFENLIREVFEKAYTETGGEVKITQASRDGGIDAVVFDPDPLRGGKIVIQAKRYTNVVGVAAVRELFGTLSDEGANKGILVTTSDFGPDAYKFAANKPIQLLNGSNLLYLLEQYGYKARIDINEAKKTLKENDL